MAGKFLSPQEALKMLELAKKPYRPKEILDCQKEIDVKIQLGELRESINGVVDLELVNEIVQMKLHLDALYCAWAQGKIS